MLVPAPTHSVADVLDQALAQIQRKRPKQTSATPRPKKGIGRPVIEYCVELAESEPDSRPRPNSLRRQVLRHLLQAGKPVAISELAQVFGKKVRDVEAKLRKVGWVKRCSPEHVST